MAIVNKDTLKSWFLRGMKPISGQFADWLDSYWHKHEKISISSIDKLETILSCKAENNDMQVHRRDNRNPHQVDKAQVGLGNADNTADRDKPVSTAAQTAINEVQDNLDNHNENETAHPDLRELIDDTRRADTGECSVTFTEAAEKANIISGETHSALFGKIQKWFTGLKTVAFSGQASDLIQDAGHCFVTDAEKTGWSDKYTTAQTNAKDATTLEAAKEHTAQKIAELVNGSPEALDTLMELSQALGNDPNFATTVMNTVGTKANTVHSHTKAQISDFPASLPANGGNADTVGNLNAAQLIPCSKTDVANGFLVKTTIPEAANAMFVFQLTYNSYGNTNAPVNITLQGYNYNMSGSIIETSAISTAEVPGLKLFIRDGLLHLWCNRLGNYTTLNVVCQYTQFGVPSTPVLGNAAVEITDAAVPASDITRLVSVVPKVTWSTANFTPATKADTVHSHTAANITGLQSELDLKLTRNTSPTIEPNSVIHSCHGFGYSAKGWPTDGSFISFGGFANDNYVTQIQADYSSGNLVYVRTLNNDGGRWSPWRKIVLSNGEAKDLTVSYAQNPDRVNLVPGETIALAFGKIKKWFADLKPVAWTGNYNDLTNKPRQLQTVTLQGDRDKFYPVAISLSGGYEDIIEISRGIHQDGDGIGSLLARFSVYQSGWGNWNSKMQLTDYRVNSSAYHFIASYRTDYTANSKSVIWLRGGLSYVFITSNSASITPYYVETNLGTTDYPTIVSPRTTVDSVIVNGIIPVVSSDLKRVALTGKYSDLADAPASLPANGGNADTVDGKHAADFATASHTHPGNIVCSGRVTGSTGNSAFTIGWCIVSRTTKGTYKIIHNLGTTNYGFIGTGYSSNNNSPTMIGMKTCTENYCEVISYWGSSGLQDSDFSFIIFKQ